MPSPDLVTSGYFHPKYAAALGKLGTPRLLQRSGAWILERPISGWGRRDAMGCYPLFCCRNWAGLEQDLHTLETNTDLVAFSAVVDPFCDLDATRLTTCFRDLAIPFKKHFVVDLKIAIEAVLDAHHRRNERRGLANVTVDIPDRADACEEDLALLYGVLSAKHDIRGWAAFPEESLRQQLRVPGMVAFRARRDGVTVGMTMWCVQGQTGYYHLGAYTDVGYDARASYALFSIAIRYFAAVGLRWLDLGAGAGLRDDQSSGLARFKRGWSTGTRQVFLCGRIFDRAAYVELARRSGTRNASYFPAYRTGEFLE